MRVFLFIFFTLLSGCELFTSYKTITVNLPEDPPPWFINKTREATVLYPGKSGRIEKISILWENSFEIDIEKGSWIPIACYPSATLKPAGGIISIDNTKPQDFQLTWEKGFLADLLLEILETGNSIENLNVERLFNEIIKKSSGDPWSIEKKVLKDAILYNSLTSYKIKQSETLNISIPISGLWISDNPFYPSIKSNSDGDLIFESIYSGIHRFKNIETKKYLDILVDTEGYQYLILQQY